MLIQYNLKGSLLRWVTNDGGKSACGRRLGQISKIMKI